MIFADKAQETCPQWDHQWHEWDGSCQPAWPELGLEKHTDTVVISVVWADCHVAFRLAHGLLVSETWIGCHK